jgi:hypothetical protein
MNTNIKSISIIKKSQSIFSLMIVSLHENISHFMNNQSINIDKSIYLQESLS